MGTAGRKTLSESFSNKKGGRTRTSDVGGIEGQGGAVKGGEEHKEAKRNVT